jgi:hypothetical protein
MTDAEFDEMKKRFPPYVTEDDRSLDVTTLLRLVEDRIADDKPVSRREMNGVEKVAIALGPLSGWKAAGWIS